MGGILGRRSAMAIRVAFAGGGTGGHIFPALALAEEFMRKDPQTQILFFGAEGGLEARLVKEGFSFCAIRVSPLRGRGLVKALKSASILPVAARDSFVGLRRFSPHLIIGVGGYASGPLLVAGILMGIPTVLQEQNLLPGLTNRILGRFVKRIFLSFEDTARYFPRSRISVRGNPVRRALLRLRGMPDTRHRDVFTVFLLGGSQGAHRLNEIMVRALDSLEKTKGKLQIIHQTGEADVGWVKAEYERKGFSVRVFPFITDMVQAYSECHLVISRAGATTIAELMAVGRASLLIPYPYAAGGHQEANARWLAARGAAEVLMESSLTGALLAEKIIGYMRERKRLSTMEEHARAVGRPDAAEKIVEECCRLVNGRTSVSQSSARGADNRHV